MALSNRENLVTGKVKSSQHGGAPPARSSELLQSTIFRQQLIPAPSILTAPYARHHLPVSVAGGASALSVRLKLPIMR